MERLQGKFALAFSPLFTALGTGFYVTFGLIILWFVGPRPSRYIWIGILVFISIGIALQFATKRVLFIRIYDAIGWSLVVITFSVLAWRVTVVAWDQRSPLVAGALIAAMLLGFGTLIFVNYLRSPQRERMPYGGTGKMNQNTGVIVDPRYMELSSKAPEKSARGVRTIAYLSPLIAGLTMLLARSLADNLAFLLFIPVGVIIGAIATFMAAMSLSFTISTVRWERKHGKRIYVRR